MKHIPGGKVRRTRAEIFANVKDRRTGGEAGPEIVARKKTPMQVDPALALAEAREKGEKLEGGTMWSVLHGEFNVTDPGVFAEDDYVASDYVASSAQGSSRGRGGSRSRGSRSDGVPTMMVPHVAPNPPSPVKRRRGWGGGMFGR